MVRRRGWPRIAAMILLLCSGTAARADVFSPGDLAKVHANLSGLSNCTRCHDKGEQLSAQKCTACHGEIGAELGGRRGFHGHLTPTQQDTCQSCHHEHQGKDTSLIDWGPRGESGFEHAATGFPLKGKHAAAACASCHQLKRVRETPILKLLESHPGQKTFLGLQTACTSCHFDEHRGQMDAPCQTCHEEKGWKPAPGFNHAETGFALKGAHQKVACEKCHQAEKDTTTPANAFPAPASMTFAKFGELPHASCSDCHADPHKGQFGARCESCHVVDSWKKVRNAATERAFHDKTRFPLKGAHADVECTACHGPFPGQRAVFRGLQHDTCTDCHADAHVGQIDEPKTGATCDRCHGLDAFLPAKFELADHSTKTKYALEGAHQAAACNGCHVQQATLLQRVPAKVKQTLEQRHRPLAFSLAVFDLLPKAQRCDGCHEDVHRGQFASRGTCSVCHKVESFHAVAFDHDKDTSFPLTGKHRAAQCDGCHAPDKPGGPSRYKGTPRACEACHADAHAGQFAGQPQASRCDSCHTTEDFHQPSLFQHEPPFTAFLLKGKHAEVACARCHQPVAARTASGAEVQVQRFTALPTTCAGCHMDPHHGQFQGMEP